MESKSRIIKFIPGPITGPFPFFLFFEFIRFPYCLLLIPTPIGRAALFLHTYTSFPSKNALISQGGVVNSCFVYRRLILSASRMPGRYFRLRGKRSPVSSRIHIVSSPGNVSILMICAAFKYSSPVSINVGIVFSSPFLLSLSFCCSITRFNYFENIVRV